MIGGLVSLVIMVVIFWAFWKFLLKEMVNDILASSRRQREVEVERERARVLREAGEPRVGPFGGPDMQPMQSGTDSDARNPGVFSM